MKAIQLAILAAFASVAVSCQPDPVYVPVYVPTETKPATVSKPKSRPVTPPKPVESAEGFRAVEKPATYSR